MEAMGNKIHEISDMDDIDEIGGFFKMGRDVAGHFWDKLNVLSHEQINYSISNWTLKQNISDNTGGLHPVHVIRNRTITKIGQTPTNKIYYPPIGLSSTNDGKWWKDPQMIGSQSKNAYYTTGIECYNIRMMNNQWYKKEWNVNPPILYWWNSEANYSRW